eukprot:GHRR01004765.1.p1 GENE.GHRR01004765.1~~GHRR01004765.1.p1  ORF type:complete len:260 (+),score=30.58 GHRR01004765.1:283-1062(+)
MHSSRMLHRPAAGAPMRQFAPKAGCPTASMGACPERLVHLAALAREDVSSAADAQQPSTSGLEHRQLQGRLARFSARKQHSKPVKESQRALAEYMALPASQYSVLDARKIERIDDSTFRCYVGRLAFFGFSVEPVITVSVMVEDRGCTIKLLSAQLQGSKVVEDVNNKFTAQMTNGVRWNATEDPAVKEISSDTTIEVVVQVPGWFSVVPVPSIEAAGSKVMRTTLNLMVPRFLEQLNKDYQLWASGDESRKPLGEGML